MSRLLAWLLVMVAGLIATGAAAAPAARIQGGAARPSVHRTHSPRKTPKPAHPTPTPAPTATPTATPTPLPSPPPVTAGKIWIPGTAPIEWQWELDHTLSLTSATDMGTDDTAANGDRPPATDPTVYDIDGIDNPASTVAALHAMGDHVVCYIETGDVGNYYSASEEGISTTYYAQLVAAGDVGSKQQGYPEYYLNINAPSTVTIIEAMIKQQCSAKGFDAVETDNDETWQYNTGFSISETNDEAYMTTLANYIHSLNMAWFIKNPDDVGNASFADAMYSEAQAVITEQCNQYDTCQYLSEYEGTKAIFNAEYTTAGGGGYTVGDPSFCPSDDANGINGELFDIDLDGQVRVPCR